MTNTDEAQEKTGSRLARQVTLIGIQGEGLVEVCPARCSNPQRQDGGGAAQEGSAASLLPGAERPLKAESSRSGNGFALGTRADVRIHQGF